ncbi:Uncharacterised protein [Vibrio cholerae]|nr:Uncharacterised protein [Vibrio cholerae]
MLRFAACDFGRESLNDAVANHPKRQKTAHSTVIPTKHAA